MRPFAVIGVVVLLTALPTVAHHSAAMFEDVEVAARGTVADLTWRNPHVLLHWDAKDKDGKLVRWVGERARRTQDRLKLLAPFGIRAIE
jgi:hypothetical protein